MAFRLFGEPNMEQAIETRMKAANAILQKAQDAVGKIPERFTPNCSKVHPRGHYQCRQNARQYGDRYGSRGMSAIANWCWEAPATKWSACLMPVLVVR